MKERTGVVNYKPSRFSRVEGGIVADETAQPVWREQMLKSEQGQGGIKWPFS